MSVTVDATSAALEAQLNTSTTTLASFMTIGAGATFLIVGFETNSNSPGTWTVTWDSGGTNQAMTQIGVFKTFGGANAGGVALFGLVNPTTGLKSLGYSATSGASNDTYILGRSYKGSITTSVAAATYAAATNSSGATATTQASVTAAASVANTDMVFWIAACDNSSIPDNPKTPSDITVLIATDSAANNNCGWADGLGNGSASTLQWDLKVGGTLTAATWAAAMVAIKAPATAISSSTLPLMGVG